MRLIAPGHVAEARRLVFDRLSARQVTQLEQIALAIVRASAPDTAQLIDDGIAGKSGVAGSVARRRTDQERPD
jgi:mannose/cellobiose epimerase-like protein (N-acyl-D-glucosamine 2-epimerase family)